MAEKQILVKTPMTTNGTDPILEGGQIQYTESILTITAKPILEKMNQSLPQHLKKIITDYDGEKTVQDTVYEDTVAHVTEKPKTKKGAGK